ncbi:MAG: hypothetical protein IPJ71_13065 [Bdellovibrionales bacterium]|nr:hypothetical protein [Bdellovibrionales bacterium]
MKLPINLTSIFIPLLFSHQSFADSLTTKNLLGDLEDLNKCERNVPSERSCTEDLSYVLRNCQFDEETKRICTNRESEIQRYLNLADKFQRDAFGAEIDLRDDLPLRFASIESLKKDLKAVEGSYSTEGVLRKMEELKSEQCQELESSITICKNPNKYTTIKESTDISSTEDPKILLKKVENKKDLEYAEYTRNGPKMLKIYLADPSMKDDQQSKKIEVACKLINKINDTSCKEKSNQLSTNAPEKTDGTK